MASFEHEATSSQPGDTSKFKIVSYLKVRKLFAKDVMIGSYL